MACEPKEVESHLGMRILFIAVPAGAGSLVSEKVGIWSGLIGFCTMLVYAVNRHLYLVYRERQAEQRLREAAAEAEREAMQVADAETMSP